MQQMANEINGRRHRRRKHRRRKHHRALRSDQWVRRRGERNVYVKGTAARAKLIACIISGAFLLTVLAICELHFFFLTFYFQTCVLTI